MTVVRILFGAIFVWFLCLAAGQLFFRAIRLTLRFKESIFLGFTAGACLVSTAMFFLASGRLVYTKLLVIAGLAVIAAWIWFCRPKLKRTPDEQPLPTLWRIAFWLPLAIYACLYIPAALMPETSADASVYHLGLISRYYYHRGFFFMPDNMFSGLPEGLEMLFWIGYAFGRHSAASMVHLLFLLTMPFGLLAFGERIKQPKAGVIAAILFCLAPSVGKDATVAYVDTGTAVICFATGYLLWLWKQEDQAAALIPAGLLAGFCYVCKMTSGIAIPFAILYVLFSKRPRAIRSAVFTALLAALTSIPWMIKNIIFFHNPIYPAGNHIFPNRYLYPMVEDSMRKIVAHVGNIPYSGLPLEVLLRGQVAGIIGPVFALAPLALLAFRTRSGRLCLLAFAVFLLPFFTDTDTRFLLPSLPFLALAMAIGLLTIPRAGAALGLGLIVFHTYASWPGVVQSYYPSFQWRIEPADIRVPLRITPEAAWLNDFWHEYPVSLMLDRYVPPGDKIFSPHMGAIDYHHREIVGTFDSALAVRVFHLYLTPTMNIWANGWHRDLRFAPVTTTRIRLQSALSMDNELRIHELRFFDGNNEIPRRPDWRLTASRNPWEVPLAFDNNKVTWWTSGQNVDPKTWLEADFPQPVRIDRIAIDQIEDQRWMQLYPLIYSNGQWSKITATETSALIPPRPDLRMAVKDAMKDAGIRWMLIKDGAYGADDLRNKSPYWGITQIAESYGFRLWKLN